MSINRITFTDPLTSTTYVWPKNIEWDSETNSPLQKQVAIERTPNTGNTGAVMQQADDGPLVLHWEFRTFDRTFETALWQWFMLSKQRTIYLTDFDLEEAEGQITLLSRSRQGAMGGPGDTNQRKFFSRYVFEFSITRLISGPLFDAGVTA